MTDTPRLALPLVEAAQAQKHVTHNEALLRLDAQIQLAVVARDRTAPPSTPVEGEAWLVPPEGVGAWSGMGGRIAARRAGAWMFLEPRAGWLCWVVAEARLLVHDGTTWADFATAAGLQRAAELADGSLSRLGIATTPDATNRLAIKSEAVLIAADDVSGQGSGHVRLALEKVAPGRDAALFFETAWSGRALLGLLGSDDFSLKVSADGSAWTEAFRVAAATGRLTLPPGGLLGGGRLLSTSLVTTSGTWTKTSGVRSVLAWALGGGGGGGGAAGGTGTGAAGGGGGAGGLAVALVDVATVASKSVTIGSGGARGSSTGGDGGSGGSTSFGGVVVAPGGGGGRGMGAGTWGTAVTGGQGAPPGTGTVASAAANGHPGLRFDGGNVLSGDGGGTLFGGGARGNVGTVAGGTGSSRGAGGSGGAAALSASGQPGGAGADGCLWLWELE